MSEFNLSGSFIQDTYQRLIQIGSGSLLDGTGSALPISISGSDVSLTQSLSVANDITASGTISSSAIETGTLKVSGSSEFSGSLHFNAIAFTETAIATHAGDHTWGTDNESYHYFTGSITASDNIHATNFYGDGSGLTNITASYITSSNIVGTVDNAVSASSVPYSGLSGSVTIWNQDTEGNAATATKIASITNSDIVQLTDVQTLTNKTLTEPTISSMVNCTFPTLNQSTTGNADTATKIASITNSDIVQLTTTQTLTNKTLTEPTISSMVNCTFPTLNQSTTGTANNALTASYITSSNIDGYVDNATNATNAVNAETASYIDAGVIGTVNNATNAVNADTLDDLHATGFTLDYVTENGNSTINDITASAFVATTVSASGTIYAQALTIGGGASSTSTISATNITASGHVSSSNFYGDGSALTGVGLDSNSNVSITSLTASSHISASSIYGTNLYISGSAQMSGSLVFNAVAFTETSIATHAGDHVWGTDDGSSHYFSGSISASSTISSSGAISGSSFWKDGVALGTSNADFSSVDEDIFPDTTEASRSLGSDSKKWANIYAKNTFFGGVHEINLETKDIGDLPEGSILVHSDKGLVPCTIEGDYLVMGISSPGTDYPIILGAEPVLIDGPISSGDFIIASNRSGYGKAVEPSELYAKNYLGRIIAQALEDSDGGLIKAMIRKM
jgi:hypothetical protein